MDNKPRRSRSLRVVGKVVVPHCDIRLCVPKIADHGQAARDVERLSGYIPSDTRFYRSPQCRKTCESATV